MTFAKATFVAVPFLALAAGAVAAPDCNRDQMKVDFRWCMKGGPAKTPGRAQMLKGVKMGLAADRDKNLGRRQAGRDKAAAVIMAGFKDCAPAMKETRSADQIVANAGACDAMFGHVALPLEVAEEVAREGK